MSRVQMDKVANDLILHRAADRMLKQGISREQVNEYLSKTPLEQVKADNLKAESGRPHAGYSLMGSMIEQLGHEDNDMAAVQAGRKMQSKSESMGIDTQLGAPNESDE